MCAPCAVPRFVVMRTPIAIVVASLSFHCGASTPPSPPPAGPSPSPSPAAASSPPPPAATPRADDVAAFFASLRAGKDDDAVALLARVPALAHARDARGTSAFLSALARTVGEGFVRPQDNRPLAAILAQKPALDDFEAAAAGDEARVVAALANDRGYLRRVHALGWVPLHFAAFGGQPRVAELLLARGADPNVRAKNKFDNTPLQVGLLTQQAEVARVLLAHGADVDAQQGEGFTALHEAAFSGDARSAEILLAAGAKVDVRGGDKKVTALEVAVEQHKDAVAALIRAHAKR
jgi:uncharacterized protein